MAIQDDLTIYPATKVIRHTSGTTVYTVQALYSWLMDTFDEAGYMTYSTPMKYNTPTSYTMLNGWFLDNGDGSNILKYLTGGSVDTSGYTNDVLVLQLDNGAAHYVAAIAGDKDKIVADDATPVGPLLAYRNLTATTGTFWIRDTRAVPAPILDNSEITIASGTGAGDAFGGSATGEDIYCNIYTIASFPGTPNPQVYIFQGGERIVEWSGLTNWDRGTIDVLITVKQAGALIATGLVTVFVRQSGDSYTSVEDVDLSSGSRTPVATETAVDIGNATGEHYLLYDAEEGGGFAINTVVDNGPAAGAAPTFYAEIVALTDWGTEGLLTLRGLRGTITDGLDLFVGGVKKGVSNGIPGDTYGTSAAEATQLTIGDVCTGGTSGAKRILRGIQDDGATSKYVFQVSTVVVGTARTPYYKAFSVGETVTCPTGPGSITFGATASTIVISGWDDVTVAHVNGTCTIGAVTGTYTIGERVTWDAGASSGIIVKYTSGASMTLANVTSPDTITGDTITGDKSGATCDASSNLTDANTATFAFTQQSAYSYSVFVEGGTIYNAGRGLDEIYQYLKYILRDGSAFVVYTSTGAAIVLMEGQEYIKAVSTYNATKAAPYGTLAGVVFFGAQGVWIQGMDSTDANNIRLTDHGNTPRQPYASVVIKVTNTVIGDSIAVYRKHITKLEPEKTTYTSHNTNNAQGDSTFERLVAEGSFPIDTPADGTFIVVDATASEEHRYRYNSWAAGILTMPTKRTGTVDAGSTGQTLIDAAATFVTWGIMRGDIIRNTTDAGWGYVVSVDSETQLTTTQITNTSKGWTTGDGFEMLALVVTYTSADLFFIPYIDEEAAGITVEVTILYLADVDTLLVARDSQSVPPIQPFVAASQITSAGMTAPVIRNTDEVVT